MPPPTQVPPTSIISISTAVPRWHHLGLLFATYPANNLVGSPVNSAFRIHPESNNFSLLHHECLSPCHFCPSDLYTFTLSPTEARVDLFEAQIRDCESPIHIFKDFLLLQAEWNPRTVSSLSSGFCPPLQLLCPFPATLTFLLPNTVATGHMCLWTLEMWLLRLRN